MYFFNLRILGDHNSYKIDYSTPAHQAKVQAARSEISGAASFTPN
jgi:hypothetical protein